MALRTLLLACILAAVAAFTPPASALLRTAPLVRTPAVSMVTAATKPQRVNKRNREYNKKYKSEMRTRIKRVSMPLWQLSGMAKLRSASRRPPMPPLSCCYHDL